ESYCSTTSRKAEQLFRLKDGWSSVLDLQMVTFPLMVLHGIYGLYGPIYGPTTSNYGLDQSKTFGETVKTLAKRRNTGETSKFW
ncbi:24335_t:CDS:2, partial [Gigaspora rosea]